MDLPSPPDVSTSTSQDLRCPRCDAHVRAGSDWCTLCYSDLRPAPVLPEPVARDPEPVATAAEAATAEPNAPVASAGGKHSRHRPDATSTSPDAPAPPADAEIAAMLAQLAAEQSGVDLGRFSSRLTSPGAKFAFIIGGSILATVVVYLVMTLVGVLL